MPQRDQLFDDIDSMEPDRFAAHLAANVTMRFGNAEPIHGRASAREAWHGFCETVKGVKHELLEQWTVGSATIVEANVTYTRLDDSQITVPVVTIYRESEGAIDDYRIYIDLAPLFAGSVAD
jgi:limonene-1,2-epoxide hydrolase